MKNRRMSVKHTSCNFKSFSLLNSGFDISDYQLFKKGIYSDSPLSLSWIPDFLSVLDIHFPNVDVLVHHSQVQRDPYQQDRLEFDTLIASDDIPVRTHYIQFCNLDLALSIGDGNTPLHR